VGADDLDFFRTISLRAPANPYGLVPMHVADGNFAAWRLWVVGNSEHRLLGNGHLVRHVFIFERERTARKLPRVLDVTGLSPPPTMVAFSDAFRLSRRVNRSSGGYSLRGHRIGIQFSLFTTEISENGATQTTYGAEIYDGPTWNSSSLAAAF